MRFKHFSSCLQKLESTDSRNEMTEILAKLLKEVSLAEIDKVCYLSLGRLAPKFTGLEFNIAAKLMLKIIAFAFEEEEEKIKQLYKKLGDLGEVTIQVGKEKGGKRFKQRSVSEVYQLLREIAKASGIGSQEKKINLMALLLKQLTPESARYVVRIPLGTLRLGFSDVTILDALSWMLKGDKSARLQIERAYNVSADIGKIAKIVKQKGLRGLTKIQAEVGIPIRTAQAERLPTAEEIVKKLEKFAVEPKMDGFRVQIHLSRRKSKEMKLEQLQFESFEVEPDIFVKIFSRNLEDTTHMFPDIVSVTQKLKVEEAIFDGEAIAYNPETEEFLPFQETVQRKRKYQIGEMVQKIPLKVFAFDLLYFNGETLINRPFQTRRKILEKIVPAKDTLQLARQETVASVEKLKELFDLFISEGLEGVMCKKLDAVYQAGARNFNWVKYKRATEGELVDTIDAVVMGYYAGRGQRAKFGIGAFLVGVYNEINDNILTVAKIGTGLTDDQWYEMRKRCDKMSSKSKPDQYVVRKELLPDIWCFPSLVVTVKADEITKSPVHTAAVGSNIMVREADENTGLALRFPRLVTLRDDKDSTQATTVEELLRLYGMQKSMK